MPDIANLASTIVSLTAAKNKMSSAGNSVKKQKTKKLTRTQKDQNIFLQEYFKITYTKYFRTKKEIKFLVALLELIRGKLIECQKKLLKI